MDKNRIGLNRTLVFTMYISFRSTAHAVQGSCTFKGFHSIVKDHNIPSTKCDSCQSDHSWINWRIFYRTFGFESILTTQRCGWSHSILTCWIELGEWSNQTCPEKCPRIAQLFVRVITPGKSGGLSQDCTSIHHMGDGSIHTFLEENPGTMQFTSDISGGVSQDCILYRI